MTKSYDQASVRTRIAALGQFFGRRAQKLGELFLDALHETRRREAARVIAEHAQPSDPASASVRPAESGSCAKADMPFGATAAGLKDDDQHFAIRTICPITTFPCEGGDFPLCEDYGCARKGGLLPVSDGFY